MTEEKQPIPVLSIVLLPSPLTGDCSRGSALSTMPLPSPFAGDCSRRSALSKETDNVLKKKSETAPGGLDHSRF